MAKWYGKIGFAETVETEPGIWEEQIVTKFYYGDLRRNTRRFQTTSGVNDDLNINNELSILSDPYVNKNFHLIRYVEFMGAKWKVTNVEVCFPRLNLTMGGAYNSESSTTSGKTSSTSSKT